MAREHHARLEGASGEGLSNPATRRPRSVAAGRPFLRTPAPLNDSDVQPGGPSKRAAARRSPTKVAYLAPVPAVSLGSVPVLDYIPVLSRHGSGTAASASSKNSLARSPAQRSLRLTHVDSLLLPLSKASLEGHSDNGTKEATKLRQQKEALEKGLTKEKVRRHSPERHATAIIRRSPAKRTNDVSRFVLKEVSDDDDGDSIFEDDDEEGEGTDLSGFIVDDSAELSLYESESDSKTQSTKATRKPLVALRRKKLQRGSPRKKNPSYCSDSENMDQENGLDGSLADTLRGMKINMESDRPRSEHHERINLTSSAIEPTELSISRSISNRRNQLTRDTSVTSKPPSNISNPFEEFDTILRFSPPRSHAPTSIPTKAKTDMLFSTGGRTDEPESNASTKDKRFTTPPNTPPGSPSKLKSPSKLLSPSKRAAQIPQSPHRQSIDAFWDLEVVNTWNDAYSPKKAPLTSPRKYAKFTLWSDSEDDEPSSGICNTSLSSSPSPCSSPRKARSPLKSPEKAEKERLAQERRKAAAKKKAFDSEKSQLAEHLMRDLDTNITGSKISEMSSTTGGVKIVWSNTLRSTAGRANWRRTVTKPPGAPVTQMTSSAQANKSKVQHYASIELASKVIDCEERLVNTLAHEFCHLANFMISNVQDQPHGTSFKMWADRVTKYLRTHQEPLFREVTVTTKHSYEINHKYVWICAGLEAMDSTKSLSSEVEGGCGTEYGRHSKSIDMEKHRCGRCKGRLVQIRPKPRKADPKRQSPRKRGPMLFQKKEKADTGGIGGIVSLEGDVGATGVVREIIELSD